MSAVWEHYMLIGLNGKAGVGKDTVADYLVEKYNFKRYAFADAVRDVALAINPYVLWGEYNTRDRLVDIVDVDGWDKAKREVPEVRRLLQVIGTEAGRQVLGPNVWVDIVMRKYQTDVRTEDERVYGVVTDMRFENEFTMISGNSWPTIKIIRPNNPDAIASSHASEQYDPPCDYTITNDGTLDDLYVHVENVLDLIGSDRG